jgi:hypothetical protein
MRFWGREIAGWLLVLAGLYAFVLVYELCVQRRLLEAWPLTVVAVVVFRGGIHLLKVAVAARVCRAAQEQLYPAVPTAAARTPPRRPTAVRLPGTPR